MSLLRLISFFSGVESVAASVSFEGSRYRWRYRFGPGSSGSSESPIGPDWINPPNDLETETYTAIDLESDTHDPFDLEA